MTTVNSLSGGRTSSYIAVHYPADYEVFSLVCIDEAGQTIKDKSMLNYINEKLSRYNCYGEFVATAEDDKTLYAMRDLEQIIGREIIWVRGDSFDSIINRGYTRLPSWARRYCTVEMKLIPIFTYWYLYIGEKCNMRIGFRSDEFKRMERFFNNSDPANFSIPISTRTYGKRRQIFKEFNWRYCSFPLIENGINKTIIDDYWNTNNVVYEQDLFRDKKVIEFPVISNCVGCFHKKVETLAVEWDLNPSKMNWFANQELKGKGTFLDSKITYNGIKENKAELQKEALYEITVLKQSCDSGGCTD